MKIKKRVLISMLILLIITAGYFVYKTSSDKINQVCVEDKKCFDVEIAESSGELALGLSNRQEILENEGMLFVLPKESIPGFWMKDMLFPLDIIWIGKNLEILGIEKNMQPCETGKECIPVYPNEKIIYVLEINHGLAETHGFEKEDKIYLK